MDYTIEDSGAGNVGVVFRGDITFSENVAFRQMLNELGSTTAQICTFDLSNVDMIDSAGLGMFLIAKETADTKGFKIKVTGAKGHVASMLKLTKLSELIES